jgi:hypothetical protein
MRFYPAITVLVLMTSLLGGCDTPFVENPFTGNPFAAAPAPDYRIRIMTGADGQLVAVPPKCPDWRTSNTGPLQNEPWPQYGCASTRNLAAMVEKPEDLQQGRDMSPALGSKAALSMRHYNMEKTTPLIDPNAKAPVANTGGALGPDSEGAGGMTK